MASMYTDILLGRTTPQSAPLDDRQVPNNAGGFVYAVSPWAQLQRFLVLGTTGGTYYVTAHQHTAENLAVVTACLDEDPARALEMIRDVSDQGRAVSNDPAIAALAMAAADPRPTLRKMALKQLPLVCRTPTHLFLFLSIVTGLRGWSRGLRQAVGNWYLRLDPDKLAYEVVKYQQRGGWSHRDVLRLAHPKATGLHADIFDWVTHHVCQVDQPYIWGFELCKRVEDPATVAQYIQDYGLTQEMVPSAALNHPVVWEALLEHMPLTALIRNLGKMSSIGLLTESAAATMRVVTRLRDGDYLRRSRVHPLTILVALKTYRQGRGLRGGGRWPVSRLLLDALDDAFYQAFTHVPPTGKRLCLALDISGSMSSMLSGMPLSCREATAALALITARTESHYSIMGFSHTLIDLPISARQRLDDVVRTIEDLPFGATDCALPMLHALERSQAFDGFVVYTDNETWSGHMHPMQALRLYRDQMSLSPKLAVVGMTSTGFSIADPADPDCLDVVGFDTATPLALTAFLTAWRPRSLTP